MGVWPKFDPECITERECCYPVPMAYHDELPQSDSCGVFGADRGDRTHAGVDVYAAAGASVCAALAGVVLEVAEFSSPAINGYWNRTFQVIVDHGGFYLRYAELGDVVVQAGQRLQVADMLGVVGQILESGRVTATAPTYIRNLVQQQRTSMLHLELWMEPPCSSEEYSGGNFFGALPESVCDPAPLLTRIRERCRSKM